MGRSVTSVVALGVLFGFADPAEAQSPEPVPYWQGFYLGIMGNGVEEADAPAPLVDADAGLDEVNDAFYFGAEAQLAAGSIAGDVPYLWLEADGRLGAQVTETMLLPDAAGAGDDTDLGAIALTGSAGLPGAP
jgi:hypothetical protein